MKKLGDAIQNLILENCVILLAGRELFRVPLHGGSNP
jgi:hypothetical protein